MMTAEPPIHPPEGGRTRRRIFLRWFLSTSVGGLLASALYPVVRLLSPPEVPEATTNEVDAGSPDDPVFTEKGYKIVRFGTEPVIVIRVAENDYRAFTATCTHLSCIVQFRQDRQLIWCYCHNGVYDLTGRNIAGPPPRPLTPFVVHAVARGTAPSSLVVSRT